MAGDCLTQTGRFRLWLLGLDVRAVTWGRRGFAACAPEVQRRLETVGATFVAGYNEGLRHRDVEPLVTALATVEPELRGFAFEGAAMAAALRDLLRDGRPRRLRRLLERCPLHAYMIHVGAGWAMARIGFRAARYARRMEAEHAWLALDGHGFHDGFFHGESALRRRPTPPGTPLPWVRAVDQGLGRSLWFVCGTDPGRIAGRIGATDPGRHRDLWSGVGLACAYAGGGGPRVAAALGSAAGVHGASVAQGAVLAAEARHRAQNPARHTDSTCRELCGLDAEASAALCRDVYRMVAAGDPYELHLRWRRAIREQIAGGSP